MRRRPILLVMIALACSSSRDPAPTAAETPPEKVPAKVADPVAPAPEPAKTPAKTPAPSREARLAALRADTKLRAASRAAARELAEGRRLVKAGQLPEALAAMERALAADASNVAIHCEAGFVAFRAEKLDDAERHLAAALGAPATREAPPERLRETVAMCLYNRARVWEARGAQVEALEDLRSSQLLRPNKTVSARIAALEKAPAPALAPPAPPPARAAPSWPRRFASLDAAEAAVTVDPDARPEDDPSERRRIDDDQKVVSAVDPRIEAHLWKVVTGSGADSGTEELFLALSTPGGVLVWGDIAGAHGNGGDVRGAAFGQIAFEQLVPGGPEELRGLLEGGIEDIDAGSNELYTHDEDILVLCSAGAGDAWTCVGLPVEDRMVADWFDSELIPENVQGPPAPAEGYRFEWRLDGGALVLEAPEGAPTQHQDRGRILQRLVGRHPVQEIIATDGLQLGGTWRL